MQIANLMGLWVTGYGVNNYQPLTKIANDYQ